jgi:hypothetical protein
MKVSFDVLDGGTSLIFGRALRNDHPGSQWGKHDAAIS